MSPFRVENMTRPTSTYEIRLKRGMKFACDK